MRLGKIEKVILLHILNFRDDKNRTYSLHNRHDWRPESIPLVYVRNRIFGTHRITPSNKASFSRALKSLEKKGIIETHNHTGYGQGRYSTQAWPAERVRVLLEEGERLTFTNILEKLTSSSSNGTLEVVT